MTYRPKHKKVLPTPHTYNQLLTEYNRAGRKTGLAHVIVTYRPSGTISKLSAMSTGIYPIFDSFYKREMTNRSDQQRIEMIFRSIFGPDEKPVDKPVNF